ncbi:hypothetical protein ABD91_21420 [Lysinibacillus sphaericus]|uniref:hypothetical protein n=1 Tax=Lysinibacillus sphaericus TaxID=1421 RepID=UPI0018CFE187|nr:hypothetical protein [Lysinibacillus sphaericus]MBG9693298.1 hypothetical protein [Lysinibacillus sphaericus]
MKENEVIFPVFATIEFFAEEEEDHPDGLSVNVYSGYELFEKLRLFYENKYEELFGYLVFNIHMERILFHSQNNEVNFSLSVNSQDDMYGNLKVDPTKLGDKNALTIAMIREVIDFDPEAEDSLIRKHFAK